MKPKGLLLLLGLWLLLAVLVTIWKSFPSGPMTLVFHAGWISLFLTGAIYLYRTGTRR